jgi:glutamyl-tRNA synthetase
VYTATINADIARHSGGDYLVRVEDTDQARIAEGAAEQFAEAFGYFAIGPGEDDATGGYGPYTQSAREQIYLSYVRELMRESLAYPCFETRQEAQDRAARQRAAGVPPGYYGQWAIWRDAPEERVAERLAAGAPYTVRFRSAGLAAQRVSFTDDIRGQLAMDDNRNDAVILKASDTRPRLPTYHFAHAVDDHLMRVTLVIRGAEWISSVPLHLQLFRALGFDQVRYAHIAPLMKQAGGSRRKLSKRHDPEASVNFYIERRSGWPNWAPPAPSSTWSSSTTSAPTTSPPSPAARFWTRRRPGRAGTTRSSRPRWRASPAWRCGRSPSKGKA